MPEVAIPKLITAREVAQATGLTPWRIYELVREHRLPQVRVGRSVWFTQESIAAYLAGSPAGLPPASAG